MDSVEADKAKAPVAPPEPISPAPSASTAPTSAPAKPASPTPAKTPETAQARPPASSTSSPKPTAAVDSAKVPVQTASAAAAAAAAASASESGEAKDSKAAVSEPAVAASSSAPVSQDRAPPSPAQATPTAVVERPKESDNTHAESASPKPANGALGDADAESELSEPASSVHSPSGVGFNELEDEIVVGNRNGARKSSSLRAQSDQEDEAMPDADEAPVSHYPKRKRTSLFTDLSESKIEIPKTADDKQHAQDSTKKPVRGNSSAVKGVILGYWRDSSGPDESTKHAVIGFIDVRERLRTRIQPINTAGEPIPSQYPLPPGPGGSWVTFERVVFSDHLIGLDHYQIKEYVRVRSETQHEATEEQRRAGEKAAVKEALRRVRLNPVATENSPNPPLVAYGLEIPEHLTTLSRPEAKRRRVSGGFAAINPAPSNGVSQAQPPLPSPPQQPLAPTAPLRPPADPLVGTRPTRILIGSWKLSAEPDPVNHHAVYGILGQNDMFRVKLVRETRDGRFMDGNFPTGAGALWIPYEEVEFEEHLKPLQRLEIKEYCRVRQFQIDRGETTQERKANETQAVREAQIRVGSGYKNMSTPVQSTYPAIAPEPSTDIEQSPRSGFGGHELRQSRRVEARESRPLRQPVPEAEARPPVNRNQSGDALERTNTLARREIARAEAAQVRADKHAAHRERAAAAAADATKAAAAAIAPVTNGRARLHESDEMQRLNKVWARQENLRVKAGVEDAKIYGGVKYERKSTGPFLGKLVSQGTIINIDGEDFVEYRVLTKPSFF